MENKKIFWLILSIIIILRFALIFLPGHRYDLSTHQKWSRDILKYGVFSIYKMADPGSKPIYPNLPPIWIYILGGFTYLYYLLFNSIISQPALKIPAVFADFLTAYLIFYFLKRKVSFKSAFLISIFYLLNPFVLYNSSVWGQWDSLYVLPLIASLIFLEKNKPLTSVFFLTLSFLTKLQGIIFLPLFLFFILKKFGFKKLIFSLFVILITIIFIILPLLLNHISPLLILKRTWLVSYHLVPFLSMNAFNFWWIIQILIGFKSNYLFFVNDSLPFLNGINYKMIGLILFALSYLLVLLWLNKRFKDFNDFIFSNALISFFFFFLPTEMHERYLFPFFALTSLILIFKKNLKKFYLFLSLTGFLNLVYVLPFTFLSRKIQLLIVSITFGLSLAICLYHLLIFLYLIFHLTFANQREYEKSFNRFANL